MKAPLVLHFIYLICCKGLVDGLSITLNKNAVRNNDVQILITLTSSITSSITLTKPDGTTTVSCGAPLGGPGLCSTTDLSQDLATGITTYSISSLVRSTDEGTWSAAHGGTETGTIDIKVLTIPTLTITQSISALTLTSSNTQELTITATCAYPAVSLDLYFVPTGGGSRVSASSSTSTCTNIGGTGCADTDALSYSCVIVPKLETSLSTGTYHVLFLVNLNGQYESTGLNATITGTVLTVEERICECNAVLALGIIGILLFVVDVLLTWIAHFQLHGKIEHCLSLVTESKSGEGKLEWKTKLCFFRAGVTTVICVIALILCIIGIAICKACNLGSPEQSETTGLILAAIGFAINLVVLILLIIMICLNRCRVLTISSSNPKTERDGPDGQEGKHSAAESKPRTEVSPRSAGSPTSASKIRPKWKNNQVSDSNESDGSNDTPRGGKLGNVPAGRKLPMLTATALDVDGAQKANSLAPLNTTETKKLKKKKKRKSKEEKQDNGE